MDVISRALLFGGKALITAIDMTQAAYEGASTHKMSDAAAQPFGKLLCAAAYISAQFKHQSDRMTMIVEGDGSMGKCVVCGDYGAIVKGYVDNPSARGGNICEVVGGDGYVSVIKDLGLKEPYRGYGKIIKGDIDSDIAGYFALSEQMPTALKLCSEFNNGLCIKCGGIFITPMPGCGEELIVILEDIARNFNDIADMLAKNSPAEIIDMHFGHFDIEMLPDIFPKFRCDCGVERTARTIKLIGRKEAERIIEECGEIGVHCEFCGKDYTFYTEDLNKIFKEEK